MHTFPSDHSLARAALGGILLIAAAVCLSTPGQSAWLPPCIFYKLTGLYCPGCGSTRMLFSLLHGHPLEALRYNPLSLLVLPVILYCLIRKSFDLRLPAFPTLPAPWLTAFAAVVILFTVARNIPAEPFCKLAPGGACHGSAPKTLSSRALPHDRLNLHIALPLASRSFLSKGYLQLAML